MSQFTSEWYQAQLAKRAAKGENRAAVGVGVAVESDIHNDIMDECRRRGWQFLHGSMAERTHRTEGEPDFIILATGGRILFVECKSRTGKLSPAQLAFKCQAEVNGHKVYVVRSFEEFLQIL